MNYTFQVILILVGMFFATLLSGYLPFILTASKRCMNLFAIYGAGILVGAALLVVMPESVKVMVDSN